jgi:hypothetical protein
MGVSALFLPRHCSIIRARSLLLQEMCLLCQGPAHRQSARVSRSCPEAVYRLR